MGELRKTEDLPEELQTELKKLEDDFTVDTKQLKSITSRFREELREGLEENGKNIAMYVTWVLGFPTGKEKGEFLTVDLGGTNLRVCWITLTGTKEEPKVEQHQYELPEDLKTGEASELWSFIAESLQAFIKDQKLKASEGNPLHLGFTFSYPATQDYIDQGILKTWTKGFEISGVEGKDVASQLRSAIKKLDLPIELIAVVNDTTGAMIASAYNDPDTIIGAIFGTGCNAAYMDKISNIPKLKDNEEINKLDADTSMAINCEYGAFDNARKVLPLTKYDKEIDEESPKPGEQAFEKTSAGLYLGEIFRLVIVDLHSRGIFLKDQEIDKLKKPYSIDTSVLSAIEDEELSTVGEQLKKDYNIDLSKTELQFSHRLAQLIATRGARMCACGVAAICQNQGIRKGHVAADGSVANKHPQFKKRWCEALGEILDWTDEERKKEDMSGDDDDQQGPIVLTSAEDGSGIGAAVIVAMTLERWEKGIDAGIQETGT